MSLVDKTFSRIPGPLIKKWGMNGVYVKHGQEKYDVSTGQLSAPTDRVPVKLLLTELKAEDIKGEVQSTDIKILLAAEGLGDYYVKTSDLLEYQEAGRTRIARIIVPTTYRGDKPILHVIIARLT